MFYDAQTDWKENIKFYQFFFLRHLSQLDDDDWKTIRQESLLKLDHFYVDIDRLCNYLTSGYLKFMSKEQSIVRITQCAIVTSN